MSDPVTNADIEDVLSSIRRLVSEGERPAPAPKARPAAADRLVLTPALRVMDSEAPEEMLSADASEPVPADEPDDSPHLPEPELLEGHELVNLDIDDSAKRNLEARIAELEAVISDTGGQWEQDGEEGSDNAGGAVESLQWDEEAEAEDLSEDAADVAADEAPMTEMAEEPEEPAPDTIEPMPFLRGQFNVPPEDEIEEAELASAIEEPAEPDVAAAPDTQDVNVDPAPQLDDFPADTAYDEEPYEGQDFVVDEEALRALVVEIVHQELQGKLGERITRNVRNMVRREIHRALTSQELE